jgi:pimeloyl-ACP methyl ester carboxylesterase
MIDIDTSMTSGRVTSRDGTPIGYLRTGRGPAVVILHGSMESARSHTLLARALADDFTVYLPDRRGRGMSGPHRPDHGVRTEVKTFRPSWPNRARRWSSGSAPAAWWSWRPPALCPASA